MLKNNLYDLNSDEKSEIKSIKIKKKSRAVTTSTRYLILQKTLNKVCGKE